MALDGERRSAEDARQAAALLERKRIALQTELEDVRALLDAVSSLSTVHSRSSISRFGFFLLFLIDKLYC